MEVKVLGTGCAKCRKLYAEAEKAVAEAGVEARVEKIESLDGIMAYGVMMTPALVIDEQVVLKGKTAKAAAIVELIRARQGQG